MEELFDVRKIEDIDITESSHESKNISKMSKDELKHELELIESDIKNLNKEITDNADESVPSYVLKERLKNANLYKEKVLKALESESEDEAEDSMKRFTKMKNDLERQYEKGIITKEYRDKYMAKIDNGIETYKAKIERERIEEEKRQNELVKKHKFKLFKKKLDDYKK